MDDVFVLKAAHHMHDGVNLSYMRKEFVAQAFAAAGAFDQACDVYKFHRRRRNLLGLVHLCQNIQPLVRHRHDASIGFNGAKRIIRRLRACAGNGVKQRAFAHVGKSHDT